MTMIIDTYRIVRGKLERGRLLEGPSGRKDNINMDLGEIGLFG
jgi:hypothetical protein